MDAGEKGGLVKGGLDKFADSEGNDSNSVIWHAVSRIIRAIAVPLLRPILGIIVKRVMSPTRWAPPRPRHSGR